MANPTSDPVLNGVDERQFYARERAAIDASCRLPCLTFMSFAIFWLLVGSVLGLISSLKLHSPELLTSYPWLTFGRTRPGHLNAVAYGWGNNAGIAVIIWLMARLSRAQVVYPKMLLVAAGIYNLGVFLGISGVIAGDSTSVEWLEFPSYAPPFILLGLAIVTGWSIAIFRIRQEKHVYVTQWYIFGAVFWLPWLYTVTSLLIFWNPAQGVVQAMTNWWFAHNVLGLWLTPIGVGTIYYLIPKVIGRPVYSYYLSIIGFWSLALFYSWAGTHHLIGGPMPAWWISAGIVGSMMMFIPVGAVAINHHMTLLDHFRMLRYSPTLRFAVFAGMAYTVTSFQGSLEALRSVNEVTHFTHYTVGHAHLGAYGFYTMTMFAALYYIMPRLTGWEWYSGGLIRLHFWLTALGITMYFMGLTIGGWYQGLQMNDPAYEFPKTVQNTLPYLWTRSIGGAMMTAGHFVFALLFVLNLFYFGRRRLGPTLFTEQSETTEVRGEKQLATAGV